MPKMSVDNLKANLSNVARTYLWEVMFSSPVGGGDGDALMLRCQSTVIPGRSFGSLLVPYKQSAGIKFPGKLNMTHTWNTICIEGTDKKIFDAIYQWNEVVVGVKTGIGGPDTVIKSDVYLSLLNTLGSKTTKIKLVGCYPELVDEVPISYDDESVLRYSVTWSYDYWMRVS